MNRDPILFRVDGTSRSGWERLTRCLTLAGALQRRRRPTYFLSQLDPMCLALNIKRAGNEWLEADGPAGTDDDLSETLQEIRRLRPAAVIVDAAEVGEDYISELSASGTLVVAVDHLAGIRFSCPLIVNPLLDPGRHAYEFVPGAQLLLGRRYALVRPEVRRARQARAQEPALPFRVLVALGDDEPIERTVELARLLLPITRVQRIDLVARPHDPALDMVRELAAAHADRVEVASEPAEVAARIARSHFAITSGGTWSLELACVGLPQLVIVQSEAQWPSARRLEEEGAAVCLGGQEGLSAGTVRQAVQDLLADPLERQAMSRCGRKLIDGRGPDRLVTALEILLHPSRLIDLSEAA
jgi:spore coat polysaccharide biosynthesis predicted glycosyltransferase SpsG